MNFVRVFILGFVCWFFAGSVPFRLGFASVGVGARGWCFLRGYSVLPSALDKPSYLEPNSSYMQKPIGGLSLLARKHAKTMLKLAALNKGGGTRPEQLEPMQLL
jgi:hypothetical protein